MIWKGGRMSNVISGVLIVSAITSMLAIGFASSADACGPPPGAARRRAGALTAYNDNGYGDARDDEHDDRSVDSDSGDRCDDSEVFAAANRSLDPAARHHRSARGPDRARGRARYEAAAQAHGM